MLGFGFGGCVFGGPTGTILLPNSTPIVTSWDFENLPSQSRIVSEDFPVPLSPMQTSLAMKSHAAIFEKRAQMCLRGPRDQGKQSVVSELRLCELSGGEIRHQNVALNRSTFASRVDRELKWSCRLPAQVDMDHSFD